LPPKRLFFLFNTTRFISEKDHSRG
jgi:hypothetical protein